MSSTEQMCTTPDQKTNGHSKGRFLKKGEGLKRFAAYKPPLPTTVKKIEARETSVKFNLENHKSTNQKSPISHFLPPEILNDDSINLSTEVPKIAPPKIMHTPVRPDRKALVTLSNQSSPTPGNNLSALLRRIQLIENTLNELKETINKCECGALRQQESPQPARKAKPSTRSRRPVTRAAAKAAKDT